MTQSFLDIYLQTKYLFSRYFDSQAGMQGPVSETEEGQDLSYLKDTDAQLVN